MEIINQKLKIINNCRITNKYYKLILGCPEIAKISLPGQFLHIKIGPGFDPLLRRPLSIHRLRGSKIEVLYEVIGRGTEILSKKVSGDILDVIGPLGKGFVVKSQIPNPKSQIVLLAGGIGVAPLLFLAQKLKTYNLRLTTVLIGAKTKSEVLCEKEFRTLGCDVKIATDDGTKGFHGRVTDLLKDFLRDANDERRTTVFGCGPDAMLKSLQKIVIEKNIDCQVSLDEALACGIGACLACVINTKNGPKRVCHDGPVFDVKELIFDNVN